MFILFKEFMMFEFEVEVDDLVVCFEGDVGKSGMSEIGLIKMVEDCIEDYGDDFKLMSYDGLDEEEDVKNFKVVFVGWK